ncbi:hypothetical protein BUALT_Bualt19G0052700 [Buddleja alternifolia]|uniref:Uncharacterized protein n=1 Tax=Buddleja alternifolia TaxID=168488 RepID=A0AAV6W9T1_9LAMI|nr:hypothetical protein BUALT_Bualt19G0052700 [Buddleja alternifolia]
MGSLLQFFPAPYIVYMGSASNSNVNGDDDLSHLKLLSSLIPSEESETSFLLNSYNHAFKGFSAMLTQNEASLVSGHDEVVSVFPDPVLQLHTTRSWDFLRVPNSKIRSGFHYDDHINSADVIIGIIDTGIWPESPSFNDHGIGKIPSKWKGDCMEAFDFKKSNCNRKLIGARFYRSQNSTNAANSPRDSVGHGTHTASTAAGSTVGNASYYGLARGIARGGLPGARIASYKVCNDAGCSGSTILKAIDDAIKDGVDIISISIGGGSVSQPDFLSDPIAIGAFHAQEKGVMVVCSAGNDGPNPYTVGNTAPWIFTVAASSIDRNFRSTILLGNNKSYEGTAVNFSPLTLGKRYPLVSGERVAARFTPPSDARNCKPGSVDAKKAAGKIVVCVSSDKSVTRRIKKLVVEDARAKGVIIISEPPPNSATFDSGTYPYAEVGQKIGSQILHYIKSTKKPTATILGTREVKNFKPAPVAASFSSRGPATLTENILKGWTYMAAIVPRIESNYDAPANKTSLFRIRSGTSMACPHVTGAVAFIKSVHPHWSSSIIKSALMTTEIIWFIVLRKLKILCRAASASNNMGRPLTNASYYAANPHEVGVGEINPIKALDPGLAFKTTIKDHLRFLCYYGYEHKVIISISSSHKRFTCPRNSTEQLISDINYPTISIGRLNQHNDDGPKRVKRVVTNMGSPNVTYVVSSVNAPPGLIVKIRPKKIVFSEGLRRASFKVWFDGKRASKGYNFGDIRWSDGSHNVRVIFAVNIE